MILIKNCRFIKELTHNNLESGDILIQNEKIIDIKRSLDYHDDNITIIDAQEKYILPGFIDLHVHLNLSGKDVLYDNFNNDYFMCMQAYKFALDSLNAGFTTIRDVGSNHAMVNGVRDYINTGNLIGPTIFSSGKILSPTENGNDYFEKMYRECDGQFEITKAVRKELQMGADFIKIMASGAIMNPGGEPGSPIFLDEELKHLVNVCKIKGKYVAAHAHSAEAIKQCIQSGIRTIEHASFIDDEEIQLILNSKNSFIVPTVTAFVEPEKSIDIGSQIINEKTQYFFNKFKKCISNAYKAGVKMGFGTDQGITDTFHGLNGNEFIYRKDIFNMSNIDILKQATIYSAEIIGIDNIVGSLDIGKNADIIALDKNPLIDITTCRDGINFVIKKGVLI